MISKTEAKYQDSPKATQKCGNCSMFTLIKREVGECSLVAGGIHKYALCDRWEPNEENS